MSAFDTKQTLSLCSTMFAFGGKAASAYLFSGVKRKLIVRAPMSAYDPKRTRGYRPQRLRRLGRQRLSTDQGLPSFLKDLSPAARFVVVLLCRPFRSLDSDFCTRPRPAGQFAAKACWLAAVAVYLP
jgi:hypothetical protein